MNDTTTPNVAPFASLSWRERALQDLKAEEIALNTLGCRAPEHGWHEVDNSKAVAVLARAVQKIMRTGEPSHSMISREDMKSLPWVPDLPAECICWLSASPTTSDRVGFMLHVTDPQPQPLLLEERMRIEQMLTEEMDTYLRNATNNAPPAPTKD